MRPQPHDQLSDESPARIIYLGDVRRRRNVRRATPDRHYLATIALVAAIMWLVWAMIVFTIQPYRLLSYLAFFTPFGLALAGTLSLGVYWIEWRRGYLPHLRRSLFRGTLAATVASTNLGFQAAHLWSVVIVGATLAGAVVVDMVVAPRL